MKIIIRASALLSLVLLAGCAGGMKQLPDGRYLSAVTVGDSLDRSATYVQILEEKVDENGQMAYVETAGDLTVGSTVAGDVIKGVTVGTGAAFIQGRAARSVAKIKTKALACPDGATTCNSTVIGVAGASANAASLSNAQSITDVSIQSGCPSGACTVIPMD
ncbi:MAG: hypothetical protein LR008_03060 [Candidatus Pacebacteria bacterium]|nr:hypothetical protein [Candidatus Paceibacterota bacterium]